MSHPASQLTRSGVPPGTSVAESADAQTAEALFHRLNNLLGVVLVNAELLEAKAPDAAAQARAGQVVASVLDALATARALRQRIGS
jgi:hypothetical protein